MSEHTKTLMRFLLLPGAAVVLLLFGCGALSRRLLFYPSHRSGGGGLDEWREGDGGALTGYCRPIPQPRSVCLLLHGNAGQAIDRVYALGTFSAEDSVYILEYPGYGREEGTPSKSSFDRAAAEAYRSLRAAFPGHPCAWRGSPLEAALPAHWPWNPLRRIKLCWWFPSTV